MQGMSVQPAPAYFHGAPPPPMASMPPMAAPPPMTFQRFEEDPNDDSEEEEEEEDTSKGIVRKLLPVLFISGLVFLMAVILVFQFLSYRRASAGGCASLLCAIGFGVLLFTPIAALSMLTRVDTTLSIRPDCSNGKLLDVEELLVYTAQPPMFLNETSVHNAQRILPTRALPSNFVVEAIHPIKNVKITSQEEFSPSKTDVSYSKLKATDTLTFEFDPIHILKGQPELHYSLKLKYMATLIEDDCTSESWSHCGVWPEFQNPQASGTSVNCPGHGTCESFAMSKEGSDVKINLNSGFQIGSDICPLGQKKSPQSWIWYVGACFIACAVCLCYGFVQFPQQDGVMLIPILVCFGIGAIICGIAMAVDTVQGVH